MQTDLKEEGHEKTTIECIHGAGPVPDAPARARMGGGGHAGAGQRYNRRLRCAGDQDGFGRDWHRDQVL